MKIISRNEGYLNRYLRLENGRINLLLLESQSFAQNFK